MDVGPIDNTDLPTLVAKRLIMETHWTIREIVDELLKGVIRKVVRCGNAHDVASIPSHLFDTDQNIGFRPPPCCEAQ